MEAVPALQKKLNITLKWNKARAEFLAQIILAIVQMRTTCLFQLCTAFSREASSTSSYKRIQRFFRSHSFCLDAIARLTVGLLPLEDRWTLCLDRTNWSPGKKEVNLLVLAVACRGVAVPLFWCSLGRKGNSDSDQRIQLIQRFRQVFPYQPVAYLAADREFVGTRWIKWLKEKGITFRIRIRENTLIARRDGSPLSVRLHFRYLKRGEWDVLSGHCQLWGMHLHVAGSLTHKGYCFVVSQDKADEIIPDYHQRWQIETLFSCLKTRGLDMEACGLTAPERTDKLLAILALAFAWCYATGFKQQKVKPVRQAKTRFGRQWPSMSVFRSGLQWIQEVLFNPNKKKQHLETLLCIFVL